jgi:hypothetical protein
MKSASKLGVAQTTPNRAKSRNASAFSPQSNRIMMALVHAHRRRSEYRMAERFAARLESACVSKPTTSLGIVVSTPNLCAWL